MIDRRLRIIGEFFQQGVNAINRLMLPGRGSLPGFVKLGKEFAGLVDTVAYLLKLVRVTSPGRPFCLCPCERTIAQHRLRGLEEWGSN